MHRPTAAAVQPPETAPQADGLDRTPGARAESYWVDNIVIESAVVERGGDGGRSETARGAVRVEEGRLAAVVADGAAPGDAGEVVDGGGLLLMPSLRDMHIHLDKTYYGGPWRAPTTWRGVSARIEEEARLLPELAAHLEDRARALIDLLVSHGTTRVRAHCNVDHIVGATSVARLADVLRQDGRVAWEIVAFPQHGMRGGTVKPLMAEALRQGASVVGGLDPAGAEGDVEGVLDDLFDLAAEHDAEVDIHLHDGGDVGADEIGRIADRTGAAGWHGRVTISHAYALAELDADTARRLAVRLAEAGVAIATTVPLGETIPIPLLDEAGVEVVVGSDSIMDHWSPFGTGDMLEKAGILAERFGLVEQRRLADALRFAAGPPAALDAVGRRSWPAVGAEASFILADASCVAEAVARRAPRERVFHAGREVFRRAAGRSG